VSAGRLLKALDGAQPYRGSARPWLPDPAELLVAVEAASATLAVVRCSPGCIDGMAPVDPPMVDQ
jgi:hypothetical protein